MATKVPGNGLADTQADERAMPPALAKALTAKQDKAPAKRAAGPVTGDDVTAPAKRASSGTGTPDERAMPPALAKALGAKQDKVPAKQDKAPAKRAAGPVTGDDVTAPDERASGGTGMPAYGSPDDDSDDASTRRLPPVVNGKVAELNEYPDYSAAADDNGTGTWKKTADMASGPVMPGTFNRTARFPDAGTWKQV